MAIEQTGVLNSMSALYICYVVWIAYKIDQVRLWICVSSSWFAQEVGGGSIRWYHCRLAVLSSYWSGYSIWQEEWSRIGSRIVVLCAYSYWICLLSFLQSFTCSVLPQPQLRGKVMVWHGMAWFVMNQMWLLRRSVIDRGWVLQSEKHIDYYFLLGHSEP